MENQETMDRNVNTVEFESEKSEETLGVAEKAPESIAKEKNFNGEFRAAIEAISEKQDFEINKLREEIQTVDEQRHSDNVELDTTMQTGFAEVNEQLEKGFSKLHAENAERDRNIEQKFANFQAQNAERCQNIEKKFADFQVQSAELDRNLEQKFANFQAQNAERELRLEQKFADQQAQNAETRGEIETSQLNVTRWVIGTMIAVGGLIIAAQFIA